MHFNLQPPAVTIDQYLKYCNLCQNNKNRHILYVPDKFQLNVIIFDNLCDIWLWQQYSKIFKGFNHYQVATKTVGKIKSHSI